MSRALVLCLTIVAAFSARVTATGPVSEDLPVPADVIEAASLVGIDPAHGRARFLADLVRVIYTPPPGKSPAVQLLTRLPRRQAEAAPTAQASLAAPSAQVPPAAPPLVPVPLSAEVWSRAIFRRTVPPDQLVRAIVADRRAALVAHTLAALDDETLGYLSEHPSILVRLYESDAPFFAGFGGTLRIRAGRVVPPGGPEAVTLWESVLEAPVSSPERFLRALYGEFQGRLAYLYDTLAQLPEPNRRFALGLWVPDDAMRLLRFGEFARIVAGSYGEWQLDLLPFSKPLHDIAMSLLRIRVDASGAPAPPSSRAFWSEVFGSSSLDAAELASLAVDTADDPLDAAWLAATLGSNDLYWRGDRFDQFAFGQRVFGRAERSTWPDAVVALRALPRARMLLLTLERMGFTAPSLYALTARRAARIPTGNPDEAFWTLAQLQASHALVARMMATGTIDQASGEKLVSTLYAVPLEGDRYLGGIAGWFQGELLPSLPDADTLEGRLIRGLAGPAPGPSAARLAWEGHDYRVDLAFAEAARLRAVREKQAGYSADVAIELYRVAQLLGVRPLTVLAVNEASARLHALRETAGARATPAPEVRSQGLAPTRSAIEVVDRAIVDLARSLRGNELRRAERVAPQLLETVDHVFAEALLSFAYALDLGDPDGTPLLARNVAVRHDFGFSRRDTNIRARSAWAVPRQDFLPGVPWHIAGSVLGLDIALGSLALRRHGPEHDRRRPALAVERARGVCRQPVADEPVESPRRGPVGDCVGHRTRPAARGGRWRPGASRSNPLRTRLNWTAGGAARSSGRPPTTGRPSRARSPWPSSSSSAAARRTPILTPGARARCTHSAAPARASSPPAGGGSCPDGRSLG